MKEKEAKYLGVLNWGTITKEEIFKEGARVQRFAVLDSDGSRTEKLLAVRQDESFSLLNALIPGCNYQLTVEGNIITKAVLLDQFPQYKPLIQGIPGCKTLRNLLTTAFEPMGTVLYILGGGWDWQDENANIYARTIGVSEIWTHFFREHNDGSFMSHCAADPSKAPYPYGGFNQFGALGLDCSGYVGWTIYNTLENESGKAEYAVVACRLAKRLDQEYHLGTWHPGNVEIPGNHLCVGDVVSTDTHVWLVIGRCDDGSILLAHSTPGSGDMVNSGGVQLSALNKDGDKDCEALKLADSYMKKYYPQWTSVRNVVLVNYEKSTCFTKDSCGRFSWNLHGLLTDPDGFSQKSAAEILKIIFND